MSLRREEAARKERILSPRRLRMGLDTDTLGAQVKEKRERARTEREREEACGQAPHDRNRMGERDE